MPKSVIRLIAMLAGVAMILSMTATLFLAAPATAATTVRLAPNGSPATIPGLDQWDAGVGEFNFLESTAVVAPEALNSTAEPFAAQLSEALGQAVTVRTAAALAGDIELVLAPARTELGDEGYSVDVSSKIRIEAATTAGLFYGTKTVLQWSVLAGTTLSIPAGTAVDVPEYEIRGMGVCACIIHVSVESLEQVIKQMAYYKMN